MSSLQDAFADLASLSALAEGPVTVFEAAEEDDVMAGGVPKEAGAI